MEDEKHEQDEAWGANDTAWEEGAAAPAPEVGAAVTQEVAAAPHMSYQQAPPDQRRQQPYPSPPPAQQYQPPPPSYPAAPVEPTQVTLGRTFANMLWIIALLGGILLLIGRILVGVSDYGDTDLIKAGRALAMVGAFVIGLPMIIAGAYHEPLKDQVRFGMIMGGALLLLALAFL